jgi:hypothetical protein
MKKTYEKPEVYFESFELSTSIATCDQWEGRLWQKDACAWNDGYTNVFLNGMDVCTYQTQDGGYGGLCYHNPTNGNKIFAS